jgi:hypothetical protein
MEKINRYLKNNKGVALVELIATMTIFSIVLMVLFSLLFLGLNIWRNAQDSIDIRQNARYAIEVLLWDIRAADRVAAYTYDYAEEGTEAEKLKRNTIELYDIDRNYLNKFHHEPSDPALNKEGKLFKGSNPIVHYIEDFHVTHHVDSDTLVIRMKFAKGRARFNISTSADLRHKVIGGN